MPLRILDLPPAFRPKTSHVYPPFKNGRYMEEFVYHYLTDHRATIEATHDHSVWIYVPVYWTHLQNHPAFSRDKGKYQLLLNRAIEAMNAEWTGTPVTYFTIVQHDDGVGLCLPRNSVVFGACQGDVPLPLIYEDVAHRLEQTPRLAAKDVLASFVGTLSTHPIREELRAALADHTLDESPSPMCDECGNVAAGVVFHSRNTWSHVVGETDAEAFVRWTLRSRFCLAPRGYGRSSFRFFEAMQLGAVPVYVWDDKEWLPYQAELDYSSFSVSVQREDIPRLWDILTSITESQYIAMIESAERVRRYFTLDGMCEWLVDYVERGGRTGCF